MKTITINVFNPKSIAAAADEVEKWRRSVEDKIPEFLQRMAQLGCTRASELFNSPGLAYAGYIGDISVTMEERGDNAVAVVATGPMVLVLEFGSGVHYPDSHPEANDTGMYHGTYPGKGMGRRQVWSYEGDTAGTTGWSAKDKDGNPIPGKYLTRGNPANMCMWLTKQDLLQEVQRVAKEVFDS